MLTLRYAGAKQVEVLAGIAQAVVRILRMLTLRYARSEQVEGLAGIAQLVERNLAKVEVAGSSPVARSSGAVAKW
jgi:hypothetical protein